MMISMVFSISFSATFEISAETVGKDFITGEISEGTLVQSVVVEEIETVKEQLPELNDIRPSHSVSAENFMKAPLASPSVPGSFLDGAENLQALELASVLDVLTKAFSSFIEGIPGSVAGFAAEKIMSEIFPDKNEEEIKKALDAILAGQQEMIRELKEIQNHITKSEIDGIINQVIVACQNSNTATNYDQALYEIDQKGLTGDELAEARILALTNGIQDPSSASEKIDEYCVLLHTLITTNYTITLPNGATFMTDLLGIYQYYMSTCFKWEHQAYDSIDTFDSYILGTYLHAAAMERLSLEARLRKCKDANMITPGKYQTANLEARIKQLDAEIHGSAASPYTATGVEEIMIKEKMIRDPEKRHFWYNGADITFCAHAQQNDMPVEKEDGGYLQKNYGFIHHYFKANEIVESFWEPFYTFSSAEKSRAITHSELDTVLGAYGDLPVSEIFFDEKEAGITLPAGLPKSAAMKILLFPDKDCPVKERRSFEDVLRGETHIEMSDIDGSAENISQVDTRLSLCNYRQKSGSRNDGILQDRNHIFVLVGVMEKSLGSVKPVFQAAPYSEEPSEKEDDSSSKTEVTGSYNAGKEGAVKVRWVFDSAGWHAFSENDTAVTGWIKAVNPYASSIQPSCSWFFFDEKGIMLTGWQWVRGADHKARCYYLNPVSNGILGACMLGGMTPDGYFVSQNGAWTVNGIEQTRE